MAVINSVYEKHSSLIFSLTRSFLQHGFVKASKLSLRDECIPWIKTRPQGLDTHYQGVTTVDYVGSKAYTSTHSIFNNGVHLFDQTTLVIAIDHVTGHTRPLTPDWKKKFLDNLENRGVPNKPMELPEFNGNSKELFSFDITVKTEHVDWNNHSNYKMYLFGAIVCIREAITEGKISQYVGIPHDDVIPREIVYIFEKESIAGDRLCFKLFNSISCNKYIVGCFKGHVRLGHGLLDLVYIGKHSANL